MPTGIKYIGTEEDFVDRLYGTGLHFKPGQAYSVEDGVAKKMLVHADTYRAVRVPPGSKMVRAAPEMTEEDERRRNEPPMLDFSRMAEGELRDFARMHYNETLPPHAHHQTLVDRIIAFSLRAR